MRGKAFRDHVTAYLFVAPALLVLLVWLVFPLVSALNISLRDWNIMPNAAKPFVGFENYRAAARDPVFWLALKNTSLLAVVTVAGQLALGLITALMLDNVRHARVFFRTVYFLPVVSSWVVVSLLFKFLFNSSGSGYVNYLLVEVLHVAAKPISWLTEANTAFVVIGSLGIWKGVGFAMIILLAALQTIPEEYYQVAAIDGAGGAQVLRFVTLPLLAPTIFLVVVMLTIGAFQLYVPVELITQGGPLHRTEVAVTYLYGTAFRDLDFGYSSAQAYVLASIIFLISRLQLKLQAAAGNTP